MIFSLQMGSNAQADTSQKQSLDSFLLTRKGMWRHLASSLVRDTATLETGDIQRVDTRFQPYMGFIIRKIVIQGLDFVTPINNSTKEKKNIITFLADVLHRKTRPFVVYNNLFFKKNDTIQPFLMADNERYLRNLPYFQDAKIVVSSTAGNYDSVDVTVITKDVLSIGASASSLNLNRSEIELKEDNLAGWGDRLAIRVLYDKQRSDKMGYGFEYIKRNIAGSFIDGYAGYHNYFTTINGFQQESIAYAKFNKPLVSQYTRWTYSFEAANHVSKNLYSTDSVFKAEGRYRYYNLDAWLGFNTNGQGLSNKKQNQRLRSLVGIRVIHQRFNQLPLNYTSIYNPSFSNLSAMLASFSVFRQDFYRTRFIYGFGRYEDVPQGIDINITAGWTKKQNRSRPYAGISFERYYFTNNQNYVDFIVRADGYLFNKRVEDINVLGNINFFTRLHKLNAKWQQRTFASIGYTRQINKLLNSPLMIESTFGLPEYNNGNANGYCRITAKTESIFFSPWSVLAFRFAPFVFYNASYFVANDENFSKGGLYSALGLGLRTRNDNLVFGTLELKAFYFPRKTFFERNFRFEATTNLRFRYNTDFIKRPDFLLVN